MLWHWAYLTGQANHAGKMDTLQRSVQYAYCDYNGYGIAFETCR